MRRPGNDRRRVPYAGLSPAGDDRVHGDVAPGLCRASRPDGTPNSGDDDGVVDAVPIVIPTSIPAEFRLKLIQHDARQLQPAVDLVGRQLIAGLLR
jgi:hypothetical protein